MKLLILCVGRRVQLVKWFKEYFNSFGDEVYVQDSDINAPALYYGDCECNWNIEMVSSLYDNSVANKIKAIITLIDNAEYIASYKKEFQKNEIELIMPDRKTAMICRDKYKLYKEYETILSLCPTAIVKDRNGSRSSGVEKIIQPYLDGKEYNVQAYFDHYSKKLVSVFMQEKLFMRAGETERSQSIWNDDIYHEIKKLEILNLQGAVDIDVIESCGTYYIIDINPRFGGGYPMAHESGVNFISLIHNNMKGNENEWQEPNYKTGVRFMKYDVLYKCM